MSVYVVKFFVLVDFLMLLFYCVFNVIQMLFTFYFVEYPGDGGDIYPLEACRIPGEVAWDII